MRGVPKRGRRAHLSWRYEGRRPGSRGDELDLPMHHRALVVEVVDGDAGVPAAVPAVGAEEAVGDVAQEDVAGVPRAHGLPEDGVHALLLAVVPLDDAVAAVPRRRRVGRGREVPAVGGAVEEDVVVAVAPYPVDLPRRVHGGTARRQRNAPPILISIEEQAVDMALKADVRYVEEDLHPGALICGMESWRPKEIDEIEYITTPFR